MNDQATPVVEEELLITIDGKQYSEDDEEIVLCEDGEWRMRDECTICECNGEWYHMDDDDLVYTVDDETRLRDNCVQCVQNDERYMEYDERVTYLERECGYYLTDDCSYCEDTGQDELAEDCTYCENCDTCNYHECEHCSGEAGLFNSSYKPIPNFLRVEKDFMLSRELPTAEDNKLFFGLELELNYLQGTGFVDRIHDNQRDVFYCKEDGSLDDGVETVSHPFTQNWYLNNKERFLFLLETAKECGGGSAEGTGIHIHISRDALTEEQFDKIEDFIIADSNEHFINTLAGRDSSERARKWKAKNQGRYSAVNRTNAHTIEIRIFRSSKKKIHTLGRIEFTMALCELAKKGIPIVVPNIIELAESNNKYENLSLLLKEKELCV